MWGRIYFCIFARYATTRASTLTCTEDSTQIESGETAARVRTSSPLGFHLFSEQLPMPTCSTITIPHHRHDMTQKDTMRTTHRLMMLSTIR